MEHHHLHQEATINGNSFLRQPPLPNILFFVAKIETTDIRLLPIFIPSNFIRIWSKVVDSSFQSKFRSLNLLSRSSGNEKSRCQRLLVPPLSIELPIFESSHSSGLEIKVTQYHRSIVKFITFSRIGNHDINPLERSFDLSLSYLRPNESKRRHSTSTLPIEVPSNGAWSDIGEGWR